MHLVRRNLSILMVIACIAAAMTVLNALKPLHMDDTTYYSYARQIAAHPNDPYGGEINLYWNPPRPGMKVLVPVFLPYLWSLAYQIHGDNTFLCKLWLFPFALMLVGGTWGLARRFTRGFEPIVTLLVAFSPAILPGMNFMLDIPTLALGVLAIFVFTRACDLTSLRLAIVAGVIAGVAINTKWTGFVVPGVLGLYALTHRRVTLGIVAGLVAAGLFVGWEGLIRFEYGNSHFLWHSNKKNATTLLNPARALVAILGGVGPAILILGLRGLKRWLFPLIVTILTVLGLAGLAVGVPPQVVFLTLGVLLVVNLATVSFVLLWRRSPLCSRRWRGDADSLFLVLWLVLEIVGVFVLSPYSAVRRVVGIVVVATLLVGRLASLTDGRTRAGRRACGWVAAGGVLLGLFYFGIDLHEARVEQTAAETTAREALALAKPGETVWYAGRWGFRHYAAQAGLKHIAPGRTELKRGDLFVVQDNKLTAESKIFLDPALVDEILTLKFDEDSRVPFRTVPSYYAGKEPLQRQVGPRFVAHVYRVTNPFTPLGLVPREYLPPGQSVGATVVRDGKK